MNVDSEQITRDKNLVIAQDQPMSYKKLQDCLAETLGVKNCEVRCVGERRWVLVYKVNGREFHLLVRTCTYLGNPHPIFKKRVQLPLWFNEYCKAVTRESSHVDVRFLGVYHYGDVHHGDNVVFIDFKKDTYLLKKGHNSSAHVYTNDLFQAMTYGVFRKKDFYGNTITVIRQDQLAGYLSGGDKEMRTLFDYFRAFNFGFPFGQWLKALDVIREMYGSGWRQWQQAEWAGWFLEYRFDKFVRESGIEGQVRYVGSSMKHQGELDFDLRFEEEDFYGDLKASDISKKVTPGNDQVNLTECIYRYGKFWYVIYEHETVKDSDSGYEATRERNQFIRSVLTSYDKDDMSYHQRMKNRVRFVKMSIIELNRVNYREVLTDFPQGHQANGTPRKPKFNIKKDVLGNENFVVFRYKYGQD